MMVYVRQRFENKSPAEELNLMIRV